MLDVQDMRCSSQIVELAPEAVAPDAVQAVSCLVEALHLFTLHGSSFLYEASVSSILDVLMYLSQSKAYLALIAGEPPLILGLDQLGNPQHSRFCAVMLLLTMQGCWRSIRMGSPCSGA